MPDQENMCDPEGATASSFHLGFSPFQFDFGNLNPIPASNWLFPIEAVPGPAFFDNETLSLASAASMPMLLPIDDLNRISTLGMHPEDGTIMHQSIQSAPQTMTENNGGDIDASVYQQQSLHLAQGGDNMEIGQQDQQRSRLIMQIHRNRDRIAKQMEIQRQAQQQICVLKAENDRIEMSLGELVPLQRNRQRTQNACWPCQLRHRKV